MKNNTMSFLFWLKSMISYKGVNLSQKVGEGAGGGHGLQTRKVRRYATL